MDETTDTAAPLTCKHCGATFTLDELLANISDYWIQVNAVICETPCCHKREEIRLRSGKLLRGYIYAAGAPRFRTTEQHEVPISVRRTRGQLRVEIGDRQLTIMPGGVVTVEAQTE